MTSRYRFGPFLVSPSRRVLLRGGEEVPLIPRYFDLLVLLIQRRGQAVHRREIRDAVWSDVVVSDGALTQAVRTLRRALGDDPREPRYVRTVSRHGYRFVFEAVAEEPDEGPRAEPDPPRPAAPFTDGAGTGGPFEDALERLLAPGPLLSGRDDEDDGRAAAEALHTLGTAEALRRLDRRPGHERARALLRDARWHVPGAGPVPLFGVPGGLGAGLWLVRLRLHRALRLVALRWAAACAGGAAAGAVGALLGAAALLWGPGSTAPRTLPVALGVVGVLVGGIGAAGVGAGLAAAEALVRSFRTTALVAGGALAGGLTGALTHALGRLLFADLFGRDLPHVGGGPEGLALGAAAGIGYALSTRRVRGMATPHGRDRVKAAVLTGLCCAAAGLALTALGGQLTGASLNALARAFQGSQVTLEPLARLLGEARLGPMTRAVLAVEEGLLYGAGLAWGLTWRPRTS